LDPPATIAPSARLSAEMDAWVSGSSVSPSDAMRTTVARMWDAPQGKSAAAIARAATLAVTALSMAERYVSPMVATRTAAGRIWVALPDLAAWIVRPVRSAAETV